MASRRGSRSNSIPEQQDALQEFEAFRKKYLLVNKHITKLNSNLNVRVEELGAQVSKLQVENLRLRASEIALTSQLKREKDATKRIIQEADKATVSAMRQLAALRTNFSSIASGERTSHDTMTSRLQQPRASPRASAPPATTTPRVSKRPDISLIHEGSCEEEEDSPSHRSRLFQPPLASNPYQSQLLSPSSPVDPDGGSGKRRPIRRQSGLLNVTNIGKRAVSPDPDAFIEDGGLSNIPEEANDGVENVEKKAKSKGKDKDRAVAKLTDVTNSPPLGRKTVRESKRSVLSSLSEEVVDERTITNKPFAAKFLQEDPYASAPVRPSVSAPQPVEPTRASTPVPSTASSSAASSAQNAELDSEGGREKRSRKSINYAEPKLNTKMRKPDPLPSILSSTRSLPRSTSTAPKSKGATPVPSTPQLAAQSDPPPPSTSSSTSASTSSRKRKVTTPIPDDGSGEEVILVPESPPDRHAEPPPLTSKTSSITSTASSIPTLTTSSSASITSRRRKPIRSYDFDLSDSDDGDADGEYLPSAARRKSTAVGSGFGKGAGERRHSVAV